MSEKYCGDCKNWTYDPNVMMAIDKLSGMKFGHCAISDYKKRVFNAGETCDFVVASTGLPAFEPKDS